MYALKRGRVHRPIFLNAPFVYHGKAFVHAGDDDAELPADEVVVRLQVMAGDEVGRVLVERVKHAVGEAWNGGQVLV